MIRRRRGILLLFAVAVVASMSAAAGLKLYLARLPDPATADREGLLRWLAEADLREQSPSVCRQLRQRLERELRAGADVSNVPEMLDDEHRERFWRNTDLLLEQWFQEEAKVHAALADDARVGRVQERMDDILTWNIVRQLRLRTARDKPSGGDMSFLKTCTQRIQSWIDRSQPEAADDMKALWTALNMDLMRRYLLGTLPSAAEASVRLDTPSP